MFNKINNCVRQVIEEHMFFRRIVLIWAIFLIDRTVTNFWLYLDSVKGHHIAVIMGVIGILATVIGFYISYRHKEGIK